MGRAPTAGSLANLNSCNAQGLLVIRVKCQSFGNRYHSQCLQDHFAVLGEMNDFLFSEVLVCPCCWYLVF